MDVDIRSYKSPKGENTKIKEEVKDLGVVIFSDSKFTKHIQNIKNVVSAKEAY